MFIQRTASFHIDFGEHGNQFEDDIDALTLFLNPPSDMFQEWYNNIVAKENPHNNDIDGLWKEILLFYLQMLHSFTPDEHERVQGKHWNVFPLKSAAMSLPFHFHRNLS